MAIVAGHADCDLDSRGGLIPDQHLDILFVEDDELFAREFAEYLSSAGLHARHLASLEGLKRIVEVTSPRIVVLDQFVGKLDALSVVPSLRETFSGGIVVLTGNPDEVDRIIGIELGADDFIVKTQTPREILARLRGVLRRYSQPRKSADEQPGTWAIDRTAQVVTVPHGRPLELTNKEFRLLDFFDHRRGRIVLWDEMRDEPDLGLGPVVTEGTIRNLVFRIKTALMTAGLPFNPFRSVRGLGYIFLGLSEPPADVN